MKTAHPRLKKGVAKRVLFLPGWYDDQMHHGIARYAREVGWVLSCPTRHDGFTYCTKPDGIITMLSHGRKDVTDFILASRKIPVVDMGRNIPEICFPRVLQDNVAIGQAAAEHLIARGCRRLAFFKPTRDSFTSGRLIGFTETAAAHNRQLTVLDAIALAKTSHSLPAWLAERLRSIPRPFGIMCTNDDNTSIVFDACQRVGLNIPEDVLLIGVGNDDLICDFAPVHLTSVDNNRELQGYEAARLLDRLLHGGKPPHNPITIPPKCVAVRQSTNIMAVNHPLVSKAIGMIWMHYHDPEFTTAAIMRQLGYTREGLHRLFKQHIGRSVADELRRKRLEYAKELLLTTSKKMEEVAELSGFSSALHLNKVIKRETGLNPSRFRKSRTSAVPGFSV